MKKEPTSIFWFLNPIATNIWICILGAYILVSLTMWVVAKFSPYEWIEHHQCPHTFQSSDINLHEFEEFPEQNFHDDPVACNHNHFNDNFSEIFELNSEPDFEEYVCEDASNSVEFKWTENDFDLCNSFWFSIGSLMQQENDRTLKVNYFSLMKSFSGPEVLTLL